MTIREKMKDVIRDNLISNGYSGDTAYEMACDMADVVFAEFGISVKEQDMIDYRIVFVPRPLTVTFSSPGKED